MLTCMHVYSEIRTHDPSLFRAVKTKRVLDRAATGASFKSALKNETG